MAQTAIKRRTWEYFQPFSLEDESRRSAATTTVRGEFLPIVDAAVVGDECRVGLKFADAAEAPFVYVSDVPIASAGLVLTAEGAVFSQIAPGDVRFEGVYLPVISQPTTNAVTWYDPSHKYKTAEQKFQALRGEWESALGPTSSIAEMVMHPAYQQIVGIGLPAIPILLRELQKQPEHWFWALRAITGVDPVPSQDRGDIVKMARAWEKWGENHLAF